jgi:WD40 repeat protein
MPALFISHSSQDNEVTDRLVMRLKQSGFEGLFLDFDPETGIPAGRSWERELYAQLARCDGVIFLASPASLASRWCNIELGLARAKGRPILPVEVKPGPRHRLLEDVQWVDATSDEDNGFARLLVGLEAAGLRAADSFRWDPARAPYPGLAAFDAADAAVFFGRDDELRQLFERLTPAAVGGGGQVVTVAGPSGSGKSSLVRAGLLPRLAKQTGRWVLLDPIVPGDGGGPTASLARSIADTLASRSGSPDRAAVHEVLDGLGPSGLVTLLGDVSAAAGSGRAQVLLVVDQAEELITRCSESVRTGFVSLLRDAVGPGSSLSVVATLRSEFIGPFASDEATAVLVAEPLVVGPLGRERLPAVIQRPAVRAGIEFEPGLVDRMVLETEGGDALPLLAYTLEQLAHGRQPGRPITTADYEQLGGVVGTLTLQADRIRSELERRGAGELVLSTLQQLTTLERDDEPTARRVLRGRFTGREQQVIDAFVDARLLRTVVRDGVQIVEVAHEALLRQWPPLREHIEANRLQLRLMREIERHARDWEDAGRDVSYLYRGVRLAEAHELPDDLIVQLGDSEQDYLASSQARQAADLARTRRTNRRLRRLVAGLTVLLVLAAGAAVLALNATRDAQQQTSLARSRELAALANTLIDDQPQSALLVALEGFRTAPTQEALSVVSALLTRPPRSLQGLIVHGDDWVTEVAYSPDGATLASAGSDGTLRLWNVADGQPIGDPLGGHDDRVRSVAFSPDGAAVASGSDDGTVQLWDASDGRPRGDPLTSLDGEVTEVAYSPDGDILAFAGADGMVRMWDTVAGQAIDHPLTGHDGTVYAVAFSPDGATLASSGWDGTVRLWDAADGQPLGDPLIRHDFSVSAVAYSPDGATLASAGEDGTVQLWDAVDGQWLGDLIGHDDDVMTVAFSPDGAILASGSWDGTVRLWDATNRVPLGDPLTGDGRVLAVAYSPDGATLASAGTDRTVRLWDTNGQPLGDSLSGHDGEVWAVAYSPDGAILASGGLDGTVRLWYATDGQPMGDALTGHEGAIMAMAVSPDGAILASAGADSTVRLWDPTDGQPLGDPLTGHDGTVYAVAYSPDGAILASASGDGTVRLWDISDGQPLGDPLTGHDGTVYAVAYSPDGAILASAGDDGTVRLWDPTDGQPLGDPLTGHDGRVVSVAYSPNGTILASASHDGTMRLWNATDGQPLGDPITKHDGGASAVAFSPDGTTLASANADGTVGRWATPSGWVSAACGYVGSNLTQAEWDRWIGPDVSYVRACPELPSGTEADPDAPAAVYAFPLG